jgi:competence protein ComEC
MRIIRVAGGQGNAFRGWLETLRNHIRIFLDQHATPSSGPILQALVLGERGTISEGVREDFAITGGAHIMAISGLHLGISAFFLFRGFLWVLRQNERIALTVNIFKLSALLTMPPIILYTLIAGARVTTVRATIMIVVYLVSILIDRPRGLYHTLALAALVITLIHPASLLEASFQLSFTAVLAILFLFPRLSQLFKRNEILPPRQNLPLTRVSRWSRDLLLVSLAAIIGTGPLIAYHFNRVSPTGLIANFLVIPLLGFLAVPAALVSAFLSFVSTDLAVPFVRLAGWIVDLTTSMIHGLATLPGASLFVATPTVLEIILFYGFVAVVFHLRRSYFYRILLAVILCLGIVDASYWLRRTQFNQTLRITSVDVGQGDCTLVEFPGGKRALIDGGGFYDDRFDVGRNVVAPFLWKQKILKIDYLVLTHPDPDHLNGLKFIARAFRAEELWDSGQESDSPFFEELMTTVRQKGIERISLFRGDEPRRINGVTVQPLHPSTEAAQIHSPRQRAKTNNLSLVLKLTFGRQSFLFTGDIEKEAEAELIASGVDLRSRVIKVPHHGSRTSSTPGFLSEVQPEIALISARETGLFRLPNKRVLEGYRDLGCRIFRTDQNGAITLETDGERLQVTSFLRD